MNDARIFIDDGNGPRGICKISQHADGGYMVMAPYHQAREGWLAKHSVDYKSRHMSARLEDMHHYTASDRVKLSHHADGFVQFSGEQSGKITSGRDPFTGQPKGLGLMSAAMNHPVTSGPTFGVSFWGLDDFSRKAPKSGDFTFDSSQIYYRNCNPETYNAYHLEGWVFGEQMWAGVRGAPGNLSLSMGFRNFQGTGANLDFKVFPLLNGRFLALMVHRLQLVGFPDSGFMLHSPSDRRVGESTASAMMAMYPKIDFGDIGPAADSLNFRPPVPPVKE
ncbi:hypothetical protein ACIQVK_50330 [Streptomyces sp. NPDC090493]|uniref:hypothetical protein n=1 Tax=Streptomyces sp. NPDC090493 TaxID=3365964 RepID=UPI00381B1DDC